MIEVQAASTCPVCGFSEKEFANTLMLGCPHCYEVFVANLETMLPRLHRATAHVGKTPDLSGKLRRELNDIESLLTATQPNSSRVDALLDRWREVSDSLAQAAPKANMP